VDSLTKAGGVASALKSIFSVIAVVVVAITSCSYAYSKIYENERNIGLLKQDDAESFKLLRERSDKRHKRIVDYVNNLKSMHKDDEHRIIELEKSLSELKGYLKAYKDLK